MPPRANDPYHADRVRAAMRAAIERSGKKPHAVAQLANVWPNSLVNFFSGKVEAPQLDTIMRVASALGITVGELIGEAVPASTTPPSPPDPELIREVEALRDMVFAQVGAVSALHEALKRRNPKP